MPITFDPVEPVATLDGHTVCFPAMSQKAISDDDPVFMKELYEKYPAVNYYTQHAAATSSRGKPGFYKIHNVSDTTGVINMFVRLYTGNRNLSNDNLALRVKYFKACMEQLVTCRTLTRLHFFFPVKTPDDLKDYIQVLEDFLSTYKLNNSVDLDIIIHHPKPSGRQQIIKKKSVAVAETEASVPEVNQTFQLLCEDDQVSEQSLYEVDFIRYVIKS